MLVVIFGAGASYDSMPSTPPNLATSLYEQHRPPLANQLFDDRPIFTDAMDTFPWCKPIVPYLRPPATGNVEATLERLMGEAETYSERHRQLASIRFYLRQALTQCANGWQGLAHGITNYATLLDQIRHHTKASERVCFVTFNYDTLFDNALRSIGMRLDTMDDHVSDGCFTYVKIHGSVDWGRSIRTSLTTPFTASDSALISEVLSHAGNISLGDYERNGQLPIAKTAVAILFPAIAIPLERKLDFECPKAQLDALDHALVRATKLLIIGWRAADAPFTELLRERLTRSAVRAYVVAGNENEAR